MRQFLTTMSMAAIAFNPIHINPANYSGVWYEVASHKVGFNSTGQEDCRNTKGVYTYDSTNDMILVDTTCTHSSGRKSGIKGVVKSNHLIFPSIPFIPSQTYEVLDTDYNNYAIVSGSYDDSFIQVYSREAHLSGRKLHNYKNKVKRFGIDPNILKDTPQD